ncbi:MAG: fibrobacter succinogenes major paralogous domain-containing protein [Bacteroidales bacterium]|nr:fibrobacter succinogenes major paralogous domain-containing protein [Bacteroidales bacterium]
MRKKLLLLLTTLACLATFAQMPKTFSYQAIVRNSDDNILKNKTVGVQSTILQGADTSNVVYEEYKTTKTNINGLLTIEIGTNTETTDFTKIDWSQGPYFLETKISLTADTKFSITAISQLLTVPYALSASTVTDEKLTVAKTITADDVASWNSKLNSSDLKYISSMIATLEGRLNKTLFEVTDIENHTYRVVQIGSQLWMAENLRVNSYNDGSIIPNIIPNDQWAALTEGAFADFNNSPDSSAKYGTLYNQPAVQTGKLCMQGWHVPSKDEWNNLMYFLTNSGYGYEGTGIDIAKALSGTEGWIATSVVGAPGNDMSSNNYTGFSAYPAGLRQDAGGYVVFGSEEHWWTSTETSYVKIDNDNTNLLINARVDMNYGMNVRCVKD